MRIATYNVEWFTNLFDDNGRLLHDHRWSGRLNVKRGEQLDALGIVFTALDADAVMVIEAPDDNRRRSGVIALQNFAAEYGLRARKALIGFSNDTQQEITLLYDPDVFEARHDPLSHPDAPRFDAAFEIDLDVDADLDLVQWSKPPNEVALRTKAGHDLRLIGVHAKSKAPHGARNMHEQMRIAIENRRKQLAQCLWLRRRIDHHLAQGDNLIVLGDFNDGPGLDEYEKLFGRSSIEIVMGEGDQPRLFDPHARAALTQKLGAVPTTSRFRMGGDDNYLCALLDYVMVSPELLDHDPRWRIWHPFDNPVCYGTPELREALLTASDHFPVTIDLNL